MKARFQVALANAQREILENWQAAYPRYAKVKYRRHLAFDKRGQ